MNDLPAHSQASAQAGGARTPTDLAQDIGVAGAQSAQATTGQGRAESGESLLPAFDGRHPPAMNLIDDCVHCGFCLPTCPTYLLYGEEMDSPRGRIYLMREGLEGEAMNATMVRHFDLCLGCLACVTACPSGVHYDKLIEATRGQVERRHRRPVRDRLWREMIYRLFPYPGRLRAAMQPLALYQRSGLQSALRRSGLLKRMPARMRALEGLMPPIPRRHPTIPAWTPPVGEQRARAGVLLGCVQSAFFPQVNAATVRVLAAEGCEVVVPPGQGCCGALSAHAGREDEAMRLARNTIDAFEAVGVEHVVVNVAGCGSAMKEYGHLLRDDPVYADRAARFASQVRDASEFVAGLPPIAIRHPLPLRMVYHDACHLAHGQGITRQPRDLLRGIPQVALREVPREREICCGSAGTYNLLEPEAGQALGDRKADLVRLADAQLLVTANPGCHLQIQAGLRRAGIELPARHVMEVLDASLRGVSPDGLIDRLDDF